MPRNFSSNPLYGLVITDKNGQIDLGQIEHGDEIWELLQRLKTQVETYGLNVNLYRKTDEYILEQDLDPTIRSKINTIFDNMGTIYDGIDYDGTHYSLDEVLLMVLENKAVLLTPTLSHI